MIAIVLIASAAILLIGYLMAMSSRDLVRLLISLELMFGAVFLALFPLFSIPELSTIAFGIAVLTIFTSGGELMILIASMIVFDRQLRSISTDEVTAGGDRI
ncbi:NADH-quinone oxidoreductase subunit K [Archaeoglobus veneficus]|uniref:F420H2:quinone oxidoreductase, 11.2 kDa subunit, putative n=1 Tax=Archaeoglobus veneficus (strain DSM 11195 / SNP6) TaxID=693661 RepID=F2KQB5_ARCVS|nr:NADH-quinone oxidoreductase subunit K [Archaeoglobus veneficus]AEA46548.1 F420H2:quinone oxidoreductase, 11.2 kDa subunit, putative [Archaeoglobus veneficus SNP6]